MSALLPAGTAPFLSLATYADWLAQHSMGLPQSLDPAAAAAGRSVVTHCTAPMPGRDPVTADSDGVRKAPEDNSSCSVQVSALEQLRSGRAVCAGRRPPSCGATQQGPAPP